MMKDSSISTSPVSSLKIDKLTLLADLDYPEGATEFTYGMMKDDKVRAHFGVSPAKRTHGYRFAIAGKVPVSTNPLQWSDASGFHLDLNPRSAEAPYLRLDINPGCLTLAGRQHLETVLAEVCGVKLAEDLRAVTVTRADAALDLVGVQLDNFIWDRTGIGKRTTYAGKNGTETLCLGSPKGSHTVVYDKRAQAKLSCPPVTRVEYKCLSRQSPKGLAEMPNPFTRVVVTSPHTLKLPPPHRLAFAAHARTEGIARALATFPAGAIDDRRAELADATPAWWKPHDLWPEWAKIVVTAAPFLFTAPPKLGPFLSSTTTSTSTAGHVEQVDYAALM